MRSHEFILQDAGSDRTAVLLPGWATDWRIFGGIGRGFNRIVPKKLLPSRLADELHVYLKKLNCGPVTLLGWSMGGFAAADFASAHPELVNDLVLAGIRKCYTGRQIQERRESLEENRERCLMEFYRECFLPSRKKEFRRFSDQLLPVYIEEMDSETLLDGLDYLASAEIVPEKLPPGRTMIVHGARDSVAPESEARLLAEQADGVKFRSVPDGAHAVHLEDNFEAIIGDGWRVR